MGIALLEDKVLSREDRERLALALLERDRRKNRRIASGDPNAFCEYVLQDIESKIPVKQGVIHRKLQAWISEHPKAGIIMPRLHGKTEQIIARTLWELGNNPDLRIKILCSSDDEASKRVQAVSEHIERNASLHDIFPDLRPSNKQNWTKHAITVQRSVISKDPSLEACGILSTGTGARADLLIADDVVDLRNSIQNPALRPAVKTAWRNVWLNLLSPNGRVVYIATPWHNDDLTAELRADPEWGPCFYVEQIDERFTPVWPEMWNRAALKKKLAEIGPRAYARGFLLITVADDEVMFPPNVIGDGPARPGMIRDYDLSVEDVMEMDLSALMGTDLAISEKTGADFTVHMVTLYDPYQNIIYGPIFVARGHFSSPETAKVGIALYRRFFPELWVVENNAYQKALEQWIEFLPEAPKGLPIRGYCTGTGKMNELLGLPAMATRMAQGGWKVPMRGHEPGAPEHDPGSCPTCLFLGELGEQTMSGHLGAHNDLEMAGFFNHEAARIFVMGGGGGTGPGSGAPARRVEGGGGGDGSSDDASSDDERRIMMEALMERIKGNG